MVKQHIKFQKCLECCIMINIREKGAPSRVGNIKVTVEIESTVVSFMFQR